MQGTCKFGFYEIFKDVYSNAMGEEGTYQNQVVLYLAASASAEFFADIALCPMEAVKVRFITRDTNYVTYIQYDLFRLESRHQRGFNPLKNVPVPSSAFIFGKHSRRVEA
jgi:solute carrier family 25 phosphate transporter 3